MHLLSSCYETQKAAYFGGQTPCFKGKNKVIGTRQFDMESVFLSKSVKNLID